jgi:hypothetical protein
VVCGCFGLGLTFMVWEPPPARAWVVTARIMIATVSLSIIQPGVMEKRAQHSVAPFAYTSARPAWSPPSGEGFGVGATIESGRVHWRGPAHAASFLEHTRPSLASRIPFPRASNSPSCVSPISAGYERAPREMGHEAGANVDLGIVQEVTTETPRARRRMGERDNGSPDRPTLPISHRPSAISHWSIG